MIYLPRMFLHTGNHEKLDYVSSFQVLLLWFMEETF